MNNPEGEAGRLTESEKLGNTIAKFIAELFEVLLKVGKIPIVKNSGKSGKTGFDYINNLGHEMVEEYSRARRRNDG